MKRPNILFLLTDQQHAGMLGCTGNPWVKTPHLDSLAARATRFERAYATNPVCIPSRFSLFTGRMPSEIGMEANEQWDLPVSDEILEAGLGRTFRRAGYDTFYGGKVHLPGQVGVKDDVGAYGFSKIPGDDGEGREGLAEACVEFLSTPREKPFLLAASFINPHDICFQAIADERRRHGRAVPDGVSPYRELAEALAIPPGMDEDTFFREVCPPLPPNFEVPAEELSAAMADKPSFMRWARDHWDERMWRLHRWAYARLTERVDAQIGKVLGALRDSGLDEETLIVFTSDHGEMDGSHRCDEKAFLYEESVRVPFLVKTPGHHPMGRIDSNHLVSNGLDLLPTLLDYAGIRPNPALIGASVRPLVEGDPSPDWRDHLVVENHLSRLVHSGRWKYAVGRTEAHGKDDCSKCLADVPEYTPLIREQLMDLQDDGGELLNRASNPACAMELERGRDRLRIWCEAHPQALHSGYDIQTIMKAPRDP